MNQWMISNKRPLDLLYDINKASQDLPKFLVHGSLGDVYFQISLLKEYCLTFNVRVSIIIDNKYLILCKNALSANNIYLVVNADIVNSLLGSLGTLGSNRSYPLLLLPTMYPMISECINNGVLKYIDFLKTLIGIDIYNYSLLQIEDYENNDEKIKNLFNLNNLIKNRTVILSIDNNTINEFTYSYWSQIIDKILSVDLIPCINDSGTLTNSFSSFNSHFPKTVKIKISPETIVSTVKYAGFYIGGTNGFQTIQSCFNHSSKGIHIINAININKNNQIEDKFNNLLPLDRFFHSISYSDYFINKQKEFIEYSEVINPLILQEIDSWILHD